MKEPRPLGFAVPNWQAPPRPSGDILDGRYVRLEPLNAEAHAALLFRAYQDADWVWDYMPYGPFHSAAQYHRWVRETVANPDHFFYVIFDKTKGRFAGVASFLRIAPEAGSIEVGNINFAPVLQGTPAATEAMFLMMQWAFEAGYRRYEWKCDALNAPSRRAAQRLGFSYEGVFRQALVYKGRNRDTAWFAVIDKDWPALRSAFDVWLSPGNFDDAGQQRERLSDMTQLVRVASDPKQG
ncbi:GNAT family N-acetyltransferase [Shimia marina]|uniref:Ribosomal-protein-L7/L12-serine acetyltransferase n=1 Tax=Shimia marina TaxID=321267 RepID=A0A0P1FF07_9RHOB|nr:GNAT family protein [Shimia marina]CUH53142.1 ribosomal-protein-L7/L12-serine acetyltransferase [Shimia marina]SFD83682.1 Protein N-acetyltransferase, RimJ/RimL family [Shimia marina]